MYVLSIDPGKTTGWCYSHKFGDGPLEVLDCGVSENYTIPSEFRTHLMGGKVDLIVIECPPEHGNDSQLLHLYGSIKQLVQDADYPTQLVDTPMPGHWKPWAKRTNPAKPEQVKSKPIHVWDAYRMGLYSMLREIGRGKK